MHSGLVVSILSICTLFLLLIAKQSNIVELVLCLSGQEMAPIGQRPLLKDSWRQNSIIREGQLADPTIASNDIYQTLEGNHLGGTFI